LGHQNSGAKIQKIPICRDIMGIFNFNGFKLTVSDHYKIASIGKWPTRVICLYHKNIVFRALLNHRLRP